MSGYFSFRFKMEKEKKNSLVIFSGSKFNCSSLIKAIKDEVYKNLVPSNVILISHGMTQNEVELILKDEVFVDEFEGFVGNVKECLIFLKVCTSGSLNYIDDTDFEYKLELTQAGANEIFSRRKGVITSSPSYHFAKPSGDHCDKFIRASNIFTSGTEVSFLAISILPYLKDDIKNIYVDSSSISFLISTAIKLSGKFDTKNPLIESFESYSGIDDDYDFIEGKESLIFISATTSGGLTKSIVKSKTFSYDQVITLFYSTIPDEQEGIFDITEAIGGSIISSSEEQCVFCKQGSKVIKIEGEQFLPETPKHDLLLIRKKNFSSDRQSFFREFATRDVLKFELPSGNDIENEHFFIDVEYIIENKTKFKKFESSLHKNLNKYFSIDTQTVIHLNDDGSKAMMLAIKSHIQSEGIAWMSMDEANEAKLKNSASVLVVAGAITSGRQLLAVARKLRAINPLSAITYLVGFSKLPTQESAKQLSSDLTQGGFELITIRNCYLPRINGALKSTWKSEEDYLSQFSDMLGDESITLPQLLSNRLGLLQSKDFSSNKLFLPTANGSELKLRQTFVFWMDLDLDTNVSTQSDVYWTIQSIIHDLRSESNKGLSTPYHSTLISPVCFDRFNDGVIQACIIRASNASELNYTVDKVYSRQMTDIILSILRNYDNPQGEGALEFIMALAFGHMRVTQRHLKEIVDYRCHIDSETIVFLLDQIDKRLLGS
ncbi:hypothetical protein ND925_08475 [Vibrio diabolicus]|uniref:hypothetical protein n=1 Tax=Vibrio diabolicus TaxID=50719 RepID=UPI00215F2E12|nr:hypothetical protein [Vibrio diabolicus]MCS0382812.1 hypothetical protein [Vibrio diabolicus]